MPCSNSTDNPAAESLRPSTETQIGDGTEDCSLEIALRLDNARAIADLVQMVCGSSTDGDDSHLSELTEVTLRAAMHCIRQEIDAAENLISCETMLASEVDHG
jgi:hypothetical protein